MPIYEFQCKKCGADSEILVRSSDWKGTACPKCGSTQLMKRLSVFAASTADSATGSLPPCAGGGNTAGCGPCCGGGACGI